MEPEELRKLIEIRRTKVDDVIWTNLDLSRIIIFTDIAEASHFSILEER